MTKKSGKKDQSPLLLKICREQEKASEASSLKKKCKMRLPPKYKRKPILASNITNRLYKCIHFCHSTIRSNYLCDPLNGIQLTKYDNNSEQVRRQFLPLANPAVIGIKRFVRHATCHQLSGQFQQAEVCSPFTPASTMVVARHFQDNPGVDYAPEYDQIQPGGSIGNFDCALPISMQQQDLQIRSAPVAGPCKGCNSASSMGVILHFAALDEGKAAPNRSCS